MCFRSRSIRSVELECIAVKAHINQGLQFLQEAEDLSPAQPQDHWIGEDQVYRLPFEFIVPKCLISPLSDVGPEFLSLHPSMEEGSTYNDPSTGHRFRQPLLSYSLTASLSNIRRGKSHQCSRAIPIMPVVLPSPPLQIEHFPHEYQMTCSKTLRTRCWTTAIGSLTVSAAEPSSLDISTRSPRATIMAPVKLLFTPNRTASSITPPYEWSLTVKSCLRIMTFTTTKPFTLIPTVDNAKSNSSCNLTIKTTPLETRECKTLSWRMQRISSTGTIAADLPSNPWTSTLLVPVNISKGLVPTFLSPMVARRYALILHFSIAGLRHNKLSLQVPIQITNEPCQAQNTQAMIASERSLEETIDIVENEMRSMKIDLEESETPKKPPPYERGQYMRRP